MARVTKAKMQQITSSILRSIQEAMPRYRPYASFLMQKYKSRIESLIKAEAKNPTPALLPAQEGMLFGVIDQPMTTAQRDRSSVVGIVKDRRLLFNERCQTCPTFDLSGLDLDVNLLDRMATYDPRTQIVEYPSFYTTNQAIDDIAEVLLQADEGMIYDIFSDYFERNEFDKMPRSVVVEYARLTQDDAALEYLVGDKTIAMPGSIYSIGRRSEPELYDSNSEGYQLTGRHVVFMTPTDAASVLYSAIRKAFKMVPQSYEQILDDPYKFIGDAVSYSGVDTEDDMGDPFAMLMLPSDPDAEYVSYDAGDLKDYNLMPSMYRRSDAPMVAKMLYDAKESAWAKAKTSKPPAYSDVVDLLEQQMQDNVYALYEELDKKNFERIENIVARTFPGIVNVTGWKDQIKQELISIASKLGVKVKLPKTKAEKAVAKHGEWVESSDGSKPTWTFKWPGRDSSKVDAYIEDHKVSFLTVEESTGDKNQRFKVENDQSWHKTLNQAKSHAILHIVIPQLIKVGADPSKPPRSSKGSPLKRKDNPTKRSSLRPNWSQYNPLAW